MSRHVRRYERGAPVYGADELREERLVVRASARELARWRLAAEVDGQTLASWVRRVLDAEVDAVLADG